MMTSHFSDASGATHRFDFHKRGQLFICMHNEALTVTAVRICNERSARL
jgi:hypothetical protein